MTNTELAALYTEYESLGLKNNIDYEKFYLYSLITHSTAIEGSTLTEEEMRLLLDEGLTAKSKPLVHHLMNEDLYHAYKAALTKAESKEAISVALLQEFNALLMKSTGTVMNTINGTFDSSKGEYRLVNVTAGFGGKSYIAFNKVPQMVEDFCKALQQRLSLVNSEPPRHYNEALYRLSFDAHLNLVTIHPWLDGNGRTARLLMNYLQFAYGLVPVKIYNEDKTDYIKALNEAQENNNSEAFYTFMKGELVKNLQEEINNHKKAEEKEIRLF
ncbi:MAG: Fic family protein [Spirochaetaceae bacterium]|jgi:Fic family protein|nr:Fic family protein [Spirochaetaceae bacterium]